MSGERWWYEDSRLFLADEYVAVLEAKEDESICERLVLDANNGQPVEAGMPTYQELLAERDELRAEVAAMRPVVEAAEAWQDAILKYDRKATVSLPDVGGMQIIDTHNGLARAVRTYREGRGDE